MPQKECRRCGNGFSFSQPGFSFRDIIGPSYCPTCEDYRRKELHKAIESFERETRHVERCDPCGGRGRIGKNKLTCEPCDGKGYTYESDSIFKKNSIFSSLSLDPFGDRIKDIIKKKLPSDYNKESFCFLTTACVCFQGLPDNCLELETLRAYRDKILIKTPGGKRDIIEYYNIAPRIVRAISMNPDKNQIWRFVFGQIQDSVRFIQRGDYDNAYNCYKSMVNKLKNI